MVKIHNKFFLQKPGTAYLFENVNVPPLLNKKIWNLTQTQAFIKVSKKTIKSYQSTKLNKSIME